ncbi:hypothetical protein HK096_005318, partial [Nowakowskiella sp. JEL0078]
MDSRYGNYSGSMSPSPAPIYSQKQLRAAEGKLKKIVEHNLRLREQMDLRRVTVSESAHSY